jgi:hypothetical protein
MLSSAVPMSKIEKYEAFEQLIDDAWSTAQRLDLEMVKFLLEMVKLELYQEIQAAINSSAVLPHGKDATRCQPL